MTSNRFFSSHPLSQRSRLAFLLTAGLAAFTMPSCQSAETASDSTSQTSSASVGSDTDAARLLPQALDEYQANLYRESETRLSKCMADAGFAYEPGDPFEDGYQQVPTEVSEMATDEFVEEYAWGYSTLLFLPRASDPSADPNTVTREGLDADDQAVWDETLGQCTQQLEQSAADDTYEFVQLRSAQQIGLGIYNADPRVGAEYERWRTCIAKAGVDGFEYPLDVESEIRGSMNTLMNEAGGAATVSIDELTAMPQYQTIVEREREVASASLDCNFPPPVLQRNEVLNPILIESLQAGLAQLEEAELFSED